MGVIVDDKRLAFLKLTDETIHSLVNYARGIRAMWLEFPPDYAELDVMSHIAECICIAQRYASFSPMATGSVIPKLPEPCGTVASGNGGES
jgi:hypothetical protein